MTGALYSTLWWSTVHCYEQAGHWQWCNSRTMWASCFPHTLFSFPRQGKKFGFMYQMFVLVTEGGPQGTRRYVFFPSTSSILLLMHYLTLELFSFWLAHRFKKVVSWVGSYLPTVPSASPTTHKVWAQRAIVGEHELYIVLFCFMYLDDWKRSIWISYTLLCNFSFMTVSRTNCFFISYNQQSSFLTTKQWFLSWDGNARACVVKSGLEKMARNTLMEKQTR